MKTKTDRSCAAMLNALEDIANGGPRGGLVHLTPTEARVLERVLALHAQRAIVAHGVEVMRMPMIDAVNL